MKSRPGFLFRACLLTVLAILLASCATVGSDLVSHGFGFDLRKDDQDAAILDYRYGDSKVAAPSELALKAGREFYFQSVYGPLRRGDFLYVKWRNRTTGQIYEDKVDLRDRLPRDINRHGIYLMIRGAQLYVYLIPPHDQKRGKNDPPVGPRMYQELKTIMIYPDHNN